MKHLLIAAAALAAPALLAAAPPTRGYLTPEQVTQCVSDRDEVDTLTQSLTAEKQKLDQTGDELEREQVDLHQRGENLAVYIQQQNQIANRAPAPEDTGGDAGLDHYLKQYSGPMGARRKFNKAMSGHQQRLSTHNAQVDDYNLRLNGLRQRSTIVDRYCAGAKVRPQDLAAAKAALAARKSAATPPAIKP